MSEGSFEMPGMMKGLEEGGPSDEDERSQSDHSETEII